MMDGIFLLLLSIVSKGVLKLVLYFKKMSLKSGRELRNYIQKTPEDGTTGITMVYQP